MVTDPPPPVPPAPPAERTVRMACPSCGSTQTQPFGFAGPAARVNMKCTDCGHLFKDPHLRR